MRNFRTSQSGAAMVEFALILPVLILLVFGIIEFGRAYNAQITLTHAAREGVREYALTQDPALGQANAEAALANLDPALVTFATTSCTVGSPTTLQLSYPWVLTIPLYPGGPLTLDAEATMRCGG